MFKALIGDLFESQAQTLVNTVNCVGIMGKGIALEFKKRYPEMFEDYQARCDAKTVKVGVPYLYKDLFGHSIVNFPTKDHWRSLTRVQDVEHGLNVFMEQYREWEITSVAFPPLGCGNGGLAWNLVGPLMYQKLLALDIPVTIFAPYGTPRQELTREFLQKSIDVVGAAKASKADQMNSNWIALLETVYQLGRQPYARPVGRTIFQKICYALTEAGVDTGFRFRQGAYGPFSQEIKQALSTLANANLIVEQQKGKMTAIKTGPEFTTVREKYKEVLQANDEAVQKTVDLFSRIQSTDQAEEVTTVLFTANRLKRKAKGSDLTEQKVFDAILEWKRHWNTPEKQAAIASAIRNLVMLDWMKVEFSESLPVEQTMS